VALDPTFFLVRDPGLYRLWFSIPREPPPDVAEVIRKGFGAQYVMCLRETRFQGFFARLALEPGGRPIVSTPYWNVYALQPRD